MSRALLVYAALVTTALLFLFAAPVDSRPGVAHFDSIEVGRIDIREPDGTLRLVISNAAQAPGIIVRNKEIPHPDRKSAGLIFFNDEGTENGGLIFGGRSIDGKATSVGSLTFDRYEQDQVTQLLGSEEGGQRQAGLVIADRPEARMDFDTVARLARGPAADRTPAAYAAANIGVKQRVFVGRDTDRASKLVLRDGAGHARLVLRVDEAGAARIDFLDEFGRVTKSVAATS